MYEHMVNELMQRELVTCLVTTPIDQVMPRLVEYGVHAVVVVDEEGYAIGIVSQTDVLLAYRAHPAGDAAPTVAGEIMSSALITCGATATLLEAVTLMTRNHIHRLVVAKSDAGRVYPLGILSMTDVIRSLIKDPVAPAAVRFRGANPC